MISIKCRTEASQRKPARGRSRREDALVSLPVARQRDSTTSRTTSHATLYNFLDRRRDQGMAYVLPPAAIPAVVTGHQEAVTYELLGQSTRVESYPIEVSESSDSESDQRGNCAPLVRRGVAKKQRTVPAGKQQHLQFSATTASKKRSVSSTSPRDGRQQAVESAPPESAAANVATETVRAKPARVFPAMLSMLLLLLALGASRRILRSALSWNSAEDLKQSSSDTWQPVTSHLTPADTAATWFPAAHSKPQPGGFSHSARQLLHTVAQAHKLAANLLGREATASHISAALGTAATSRSPGQNSNIRHQKGVSTAASSSEGSLTSAGTATGTSTTPDASKPQTVLPAGAIQMYAVIDDTVISPYKGATWGEVIRHIAKRLQWSDSRFLLNIITQQQLKDDASTRESLSKALSSGGSDVKSSPIFVGVAITDQDVSSYINGMTAKLPTALFWDSGEDLCRSSRVDGFAPASAGPLAQLLSQRVGFSKEARAANVIKTLGSLWSRHTSDDLLFIWLVLLNEYVTPVPAVANTTKGTDLQSLYCMIKNCGQKIVDCVTDTTCKKGLDCLEGCAFNDQVCQYRCIVSYETPKFEQFALCILQLHNCRGLDAQMPMVPDPAPMTSWRGQAMTHEIAESLFIGWKQTGPQLPEGGDGQLKPYSWLVAAGKNPAYDYFPCQHQLYSYGKGKGQMWYEPVFKAITLDGQEVWRRRRYRVRRGSTPGTFYYSVLDNGVTSNEYWRIIDCAEDLTYCLFYYSGAAAAAGLSYSGAVLGTVDGSWPAAYTERIHAALQVAGIEPWELSTVDNSQCVGAPL